jgi:hypothetical protein
MEGLPQPTPAEMEQSRLCYEDIVELLNRLIKEGMHPAAISSGLATATIHFVMTHQGAEQVPIWFARHSAFTMHMGERRASN